MQHRERLRLMPRRPRRPPSCQRRPRSIKGSHALKPVAGMVKTIIMTSVRAIGPGAGPSMLNLGVADIVRGHMVVHDLGAGSERVGGPLAAWASDVTMAVVCLIVGASWWYSPRYTCRREAAMFPTHRI